MFDSKCRWSATKLSGMDARAILIRALTCDEKSRVHHNVPCAVPMHLAQTRLDWCIEQIAMLRLTDYHRRHAFVRVVST